MELHLQVRPRLGNKRIALSNSHTKKVQRERRESEINTTLLQNGGFKAIEKGQGSYHSSDLIKEKAKAQGNVEKRV